MSDVSLAALARYYREQAKAQRTLADREQAQLPLMVRGQSKAKACIDQLRTVAIGWEQLADEIDEYLAQKHPHEQDALL